MLFSTCGASLTVSTVVPEGGPAQTKPDSTPPSPELDRAAQFLIRNPITAEL